MTSCPGRVDEIPKESKQLSRYILDVYRWVFTLHYFVVFVKQKQPFASLQSNNPPPDMGGDGTRKQYTSAAPISLSPFFCSLRRRRLLLRQWMGALFN